MTRRPSLSPYVLACAVLAPLACADGDESRDSANQSGSGQVTTATATATMTATATLTDPTTGEGGVSDSADTSGGSTPPDTGVADTTNGETGSASAETGDPDTTNATNTTMTSNTTQTTDSTTGGETTDPTNGEESSGGACAEVTVEAENKKQPADIIFVIDNSGSMDFEENAVQDNMNQFSQKIIASGIDAHVVLLSSYNICIAPPLGSGGCPNFDTKLPQFLHVDVSIGSNNPLQKLLEHKADWEPSMRPDGFKHVVIVSDDDSDLSANSFHQQFTAYGPPYDKYKLHAIVGLWDASDVGKCLGDPFCCATIAAEGEQYKSLTGLTGGVLGELCDNGQQNFTQLFDTLSMDVIAEAKIACEWTIPDAMGMDIDFNKVNVDYKNGMGGEQAIPKVESMADCQNLEAWYYDDPADPTKIYACPALCMKIQGNPLASVDVKFGCESIVPQ
ncbi:MAG: VWA domain-containing protein [Myxococcales bacterium]|nr:VWA domain-containing protein [Myxococcales bacterium]